MYEEGTPEFEAWADWMFTIGELTGVIEYLTDSHGHVVGKSMDTSKYDQNNIYIYDSNKQPYIN